MGNDHLEWVRCMVPVATAYMSVLMAYHHWNGEKEQWGRMD